MAYEEEGVTAKEDAYILKPGQFVEDINVAEMDEHKKEDDNG